MNCLLVHMGLCGSLTTLVYLAIKKIFRTSLSPVCRRSLLRLSLMAYLLPLPFLSDPLRDIVRFLTGHEELFRRKLLPGCTYLICPDKIFRKIDGELIPPGYLTAAKYAFFIWLAVFTAMTVYLLWAYLRVRRVIMCASREDHSSELADRYGHRISWRKIYYRRTKADLSPCSFGLFHPVIVLPEDMDQKDIPYVVKHELGHIRAWDCLVQVLSFLAVALHFYNPLVYYLVKEIRSVGELCCDREVLRDATERERMDYGGILIDYVAGKRTLSGVSTLTGHNKAVFHERIRMIKEPVRTRRPVFALCVAAMLFFASLPVLAYDMPGIAVVSEGLKQDVREDKDRLESSCEEGILPEDEMKE